ncbi:caspase domain-containing protein [Desarmillaria tabescens]|uniref:Caspase domain-containing protein n=1 Tax=Armillaria tabescens TaxID=1929756 RepID=A0AA39TSH4_ARMTA|nr:caspase domain-containing protein [Desarmillaria tabescens]KAK0462314.1 caspase domain-containing protein [Desarmillaria tabescens]
MFPRPANSLSNGVENTACSIDTGDPLPERASLVLDVAHPKHLAHTMSETYCDTIQMPQFNTTRFWDTEDANRCKEKLKQIQLELVPLEALELALAEKFVSDQNFDSAHIRVELMIRALDDNYYQLYVPDMDKLHKLRMERSSILGMLSEHEVVRRDLPFGPSPRLNGRRTWAVLIGINEYLSIRPLFGCVSDVHLMEKYLTMYLGVPQNRIQLLLNSKEQTPAHDRIPLPPSRANIIRTLTGLITEDEIKYGDNIVIYYAGHGASYYEDEGNLGFVKALCPIDRDVPDTNGIPISDISDREINVILTEISRAKGHRITVIFDCCHSAGASREVPQPGARMAYGTRSATLQDMLLVGDGNLKGYDWYRPGSILEKGWLPDRDSHVLIAACESYQFAYEKKVVQEDGTVGHVGIFTSSLVRALQSAYCDEGRTYAEIIRALECSCRQQPVVYGTHKNARFWYQDF